VRLFDRREALARHGPFAETVGSEEAAERVGRSADGRDVGGGIPHHFAGQRSPPVAVERQAARHDVHEWFVGAGAEAFGEGRGGGLQRLAEGHARRETPLPPTRREDRHDGAVERRGIKEQEVVWHGIPRVV
jgi:hypothetical protein